MKKEKNKTQYLSRGLYTTCDHEKPHFYIKANKVKFIEGEKIISGPANLIIEDIPTQFSSHLQFFLFLIKDHLEYYYRVMEILLLLDIILKI